MPHVRLLAGLLLLAPAGHSSPPPGEAEEAPTIRSYFGEPIPLPPAQAAAFDRGARLFVRDWSSRADGVRNANSCLDCHSVPMPGGSGMSERALVAIQEDEPPGSREEVVQRSDPAQIPASVRRTPALFGIGFLEKAESPGGIHPFRLGVHARQPSLTAFVTSAFATELGVSSKLHCSRPTPAAAYRTRCKPGIRDDELADILAYLRYLAPPPKPSRDSQRGAELFAEMACSTCHTERVRAANPLDSTQRLWIRPFSDLRTHDIGTSRKGAVRTAPLWGLNSYGPPYLNDGSAPTIEGAILAHRGEALDAQMRFRALPAPERDAFLLYLRSF